MRSKEVSEAIDMLKNGIADYVLGFYCTEEKEDKKLCNNYCEENNEDCIYNQVIDTVTNYIEKLEFKYQARKDKYETKIKELEKENTDAKEYADDVWRKQEELRAENEKLQDELIEEKQFNVKCLKLRDEEYIKKSVIRDKIKELEELRDKYIEENKFGSYMEVEGKIEVLKELLEGE